MRASGHRRGPGEVSGSIAVTNADVARQFVNDKHVRIAVAIEIARRKKFAGRLIDKRLRLRAGQKNLAEQSGECHDAGDFHGVVGMVTVPAGINSAISRWALMRATKYW